MTISKSSMALNNLRAVVILIVMAFHSVLAYLGSLGPAAFPFDRSPYEWRAFPIVDSHRWFGFDVFCAWQDVYLMALMFFLSALFAWPSLARKGTRKFLSDRFLRLGVPFIFAIDRRDAARALSGLSRDGGRSRPDSPMRRHYLALPFWPNGPMWFLWQLLALSFLAAAAASLRPELGRAYLARLSASAAAVPAGIFIGLAAASALAYVPLALALHTLGLVRTRAVRASVQPPAALLRLYLAGLGVGAHGLDRGLLAPDGHAGAALGRLARVCACVLPALDGADRPGDDATRRRRRSACNSPSDIGFAWLARRAAFSLLAVCLRFGAMAFADIGQSGGQRLWHVFVSLSVCRLAAICAAGRGVVRHREGHDRVRRNAAACLGNGGRRALGSVRFATDRQRATVAGDCAAVRQLGYRRPIRSDRNIPLAASCD